MMEGRLITGDQREFSMPSWDGTNHSGYQPLDDKVLVLMDEHVELTSGGIVIPQATAERQSMAGETGLVVALGPAAFQWNDDLTRKWVGRSPEPGDRVYIERYAGQLVQGIDGRTYRLKSQRCVGALALPPPEVVMEPGPVEIVRPVRKERRRANGNK
jgi:chaperonin GroES